MRNVEFQEDNKIQRVVDYFDGWAKYHPGKSPQRKPFEAVGGAL